jgi:hypothetical protein
MDIDMNLIVSMFETQIEHNKKYEDQSNTWLGKTMFKAR